MSSKAGVVEAIGADRQLALLLALGVDPQGQRHTLPSLARATGVSDQTLLNWLNGKTASPRLQTVRALCRVYGITLDYFDLETEADCRAYLINHQAQLFPLIRSICELANHLSPISQRYLQRILSWIRAKEAQRLPH